jgi:hypothetical protein
MMKAIVGAAIFVAAIVILEFIELPDFFEELTKSSKQHNPDYQQ